MAISRREILLTSAVAGLRPTSTAGSRAIISIVRIRNGKIAYAVEKAIDLLGGMRQVTKGVNTVMLKPNLVSTQAEATTKLAVVRALAETMQRAGKHVSIGEGSAAAPNFNIVGSAIYRTRQA